MIENSQTHDPALNPRHKGQMVSHGSRRKSSVGSKLEHTSFAITVERSIRFAIMVIVPIINVSHTWRASWPFHWKISFSSTYFHNGGWNRGIDFSVDQCDSGLKERKTSLKVSLCKRCPPPIFENGHLNSVANPFWIKIVLFGSNNHQNRPNFCQKSCRNRQDFP